MELQTKQEEHTSRRRKKKKKKKKQKSPQCKPMSKTTRSIFQIASLSMVILSVTGASRCQTAGASDHQTSGWELLQTNDDQGLFQSRISCQGVRIDSDQFTILILSPKFQPIVYNNSNKRFFVEPPNVKVPAGKPSQWMKIKDELMGEMPVTHYRSKSERGGEVTTDLWTLRAPGMPPGLINSCVRCIALREIPQTLGLPVKIITHGISGHGHTYMDIKNVKKVSFGKDAFRAPAGYQKVEDFVALRADTTLKAKDRDVSDLFEDNYAKLRLPKQYKK
ncbi:MAG TPA: hypothetical protein V6C72_08450 [Chroococcales cyanobacterium]